MKNTLQGFFVVVGILLLGPSLAFASFNASLNYGQSGNVVLQLQEFLVSQGCLSVQPTGYFGSLTLAGVKCFQYKYGIPNTGYFGSLSRAEANAIISLPASSSAYMPAQGTQSSVDMSQGVNAAAPLSPLVGTGSTTVLTPSPSSTWSLSPLVGSGQVPPATTSMSQGTNAAPSLSPLIDSSSGSQ